MVGRYMWWWCKQAVCLWCNEICFFSAAVCEIIEHRIIDNLDVIHLHDWHAAGVSVLAKFSPRFVYLKTLKLVYTVHNLALQGIRPFNHDESSLEAWFPTLNYDGHQICDHQYPHCYNPMRSGLNLCDVIHVVSPTYSFEVQETSRPDEGFFWWWRSGTWHAFGSEPR